MGSFVESSSLRGNTASSIASASCKFGFKSCIRIEEVAANHFILHLDDTCLVVDASKVTETAVHDNIGTDPNAKSLVLLSKAFRFCLCVLRTALLISVM